MRAKITADERLVISADNELEAFALRTWYGRYRNRKSAKLEMDIPEEFFDHEEIKKMIDQLGKHIPDYRKWLDEHHPEIAAKWWLE